MKPRAQCMGTHSLHDFTGLTEAQQCVLRDEVGLCMQTQAP